MNIIAACGWSFDKRMWAPLQGFLPSHSFTFIDPLRAREEVAAWGGQPCWLLGFSLGAFALFPLLGMPGVLGGAFCALAESFARSGGNPYGAPRETIEAMKQGLRTDKKAVLDAFWKKCFKPHGVERSILPSVEELETDLLHEGLSRLTMAQLGTHPTSKPVVLVQGSHDRILAADGARLMAHGRGLPYHELTDAGHAFPITHPADLARILDQAMGISA